MGRQQILADITDFGLNPEKSHSIVGNRLREKVLETRGTWEHEDMITSEPVIMPIEEKVETSQSEIVQEIAETSVELIEKTIEDVPMEVAAPQVETIIETTTTDEKPKKPVKKKKSSDSAE